MEIRDYFLNWYKKICIPSEMLDHDHYKYSAKLWKDNTLWKFY